MYSCCHVKMLSKSGHYFVYCGSQHNAQYKWSEVYPSIPFSSVEVSSTVLYEIE
jgi:hypothetical protein